MTDLRTRLADLRAATLRQLADADTIDGGMLELLAHSASALDALDQQEVDIGDADRLIVTEAHGEPVTVTAYAAGDRKAIIHLTPSRAVSLAHQLLDAALRRLPR